MSDLQINQVLQQMRALAAQAESRPVDATTSAEGPDFASLLKESIDQVNATSKTAGDMATAFERGDGNADLAEVMVAVQKASISFEAMTQVRNKLLNAYKEIMSMPV